MVKTRAMETEMANTAYGHTLFSTELELTTARASFFMPESESSTTGTGCGSGDRALDITDFPRQMLALAFGGSYKGTRWAIREKGWGFRGSYVWVGSAIRMVGNV